MSEEIALRKKWADNTGHRSMDIQDNCTGRCQQSEDGAGPCEIYERLSVLHKENPRFWSEKLTNWKPVAPDFRRSIRDEMARREIWERNAAHMRYDIQNSCEKKCQESDRPCDTFEKVKELHKEYRGIGLGS